MNARKTPLDGVWVVEFPASRDERGSFSRAWCAREFRSVGISAEVAQISIAKTAEKGTLRGMHYQADPHGETKLVRCLRGAIYDVALDIRRDSPSFGRWFSIELRAENDLALAIPPGCAHGLQTLVDDVEVLYVMSTEYVESAARVVRWNDPQFAIDWPPVEPRILSARDATAPDFT